MMKANTNLIIILLLFTTLNVLTINTQFFHHSVQDEKLIEIKLITDDQGKIMVASYDLKDLSLTCDGKGQALNIKSLDFLENEFADKAVNSISFINSQTINFDNGISTVPIEFIDVSNLRITNSTVANITKSTYTYGIMINNSPNIRVENTTIFNITSTSNSASGIHVIDSNGVKIWNNTIEKIVSTSTAFSDPRDVYGIRIESSQNTNIAGNEIKRTDGNIIKNLDTEGLAFGIFGESASDIFLNNSVLDDINSKLSQGIYLKDSPSPYIRNTSITNLLSSTQSSYGISLRNCTDSSVILNDIITLDAALSIRGIYFDNCNQSFAENNTIDSLSSTYTDVHGIGLSMSSETSVQWNIINDLNAPNSEAIGIHSEESPKSVFRSNTITDITPSIGLYLYSCPEADIADNTISNVDNWIYVDDTSPNVTYSSNTVGGQVIRLLNFTRPIDQNIEESSSNKFITWKAFDSEAATYTIYRDGSLLSEGIWIDGSAIDHPINESLLIGPHIFQIILTETDGQNISDEVTINIVEMDEPILIESPDDLRYLVGASNQFLSWNISDNYPFKYTIYRNGTEIAFDSWSSYELIYISVSGLALGVYNYTLVADDVSGNIVNHSVLVYVFQASDI
ncbi:MAG: right-handed parallel beta-helix repeat-containing protein, partial [Candidatus Kariarchaeaceae archaeon]